MREGMFQDTYIYPTIKPCSLPANMDYLLFSDSPLAPEVDYEYSSPPPQSLCKILEFPVNQEPFLHWLTVVSVAVGLFCNTFPPETKPDPSSQLVLRARSLATRLIQRV